MATRSARLPDEPALDSPVTGDARRVRQVGSVPAPPGDPRPGTQLACHLPRLAKVGESGGPRRAAGRRGRYVEGGVCSWIRRTSRTCTPNVSSLARSPCSAA